MPSTIPPSVNTKSGRKFCKPVPFEFPEPVKRISINPAAATTPTTKISPSHDLLADLSAENSPSPTNSSCGSNTNKPFISLGQDLRDRCEYDSGSSLRSSTGSDSVIHPSKNYTKKDLYDKWESSKHDLRKQISKSETSIQVLNNKLTRESSYLVTSEQKIISLQQKLLKSETQHGGTKECVKHLSNTIKLMTESKKETKTLHDATLDLRLQTFKVSTDSVISELKLAVEKQKLTIISNERYKLDSFCPNRMLIDRN